MSVGILGGLIGALCMDVSSLILWRTKKTESLHGHIAGSMIMSPIKLNQRKNFILGQIFHMTVASGIGVGMVEILKKYGKDNHNLKGGFLSVLTWGFLYIFGQKMGFYRMNPRLTKSSYSEIWQHLVYGLVTSNAIVALADPTIFSKKSSINTQALIQGKNRVRSVQPIYSDVNADSTESPKVIN
ncbi:hypothetical protein SAMN05443529_10477 [Desulfosporosinus hippei DSM 8344]|uniref:Uncharacterized protein n=2 Tax=Desulfosporosinus TaxID=79206 RepID=A0A1G7VC31_9FIRM|nr:hypothetical protein SAMN05443529_10477 [Desulfosporosinus hippei DSM 8344]